MWSTGNGTRHPVVAGTGTSSLVTVEKGSGTGGWKWMAGGECLLPAGSPAPTDDLVSFPRYK